MKAGCFLLAVAVLLAAGRMTDAAAGRLDEVRTRGHLVCGVAADRPGFSRVDKAGAWSGFDVDFCRAVAAAVLGSRDAVKFRPLSEADRFQALRAGEIDVLARATTWTLSRDTELGLRFVGVLFHDGQGFLVRRGHAVTSVLELSGSTVCVLAGSGAEQGVTDFFQSRQMRIQLVVAERWADLVNSYVAGSCTLLSGDVSLLAFERSRLPEPGDHMLLPELITKEPLGPAVRQGDDQWFGIVRWVLLAMISAEELGVTSETVDGLSASPLQDVRRLLGVDSNLGRAMGLGADWAYQLVRQVGNYGEVFDRNLGAKSPLALERGMNNLWMRGGIMYAPPLR